MKLVLPHSFSNEKPLYFFPRHSKLSPPWRAGHSPPGNNVLSPADQSPERFFFLLCFSPLSFLFSLTSCASRLSLPSSASPNRKASNPLPFFSFFRENRSPFLEQASLFESPFFFHLPSRDLKRNSSSRSFLFSR